jgi:hypothetical protein
MSLAAPFSALFPSVAKPVIGMLHVAALPGTPAYRLSPAAIEAAALAEAETLRAGGVHAVMLENMHDAPYLRGAVGPEIVATLAIVCRAVKAATQLPCGVQILAGANLDALAVAHAAGLDFIRAEAFAFAHVADEGVIESSAAALLRYRKMIGAERIQVWADVKKKHASHAVTADIGVAESAAAVEFLRGDAVIVTGAVTGDAPQTQDADAAKRGCGLPVLLGSGVTADNLAKFYPVADGFIVGSDFKRDGRWRNSVALDRVIRFMDAFSALAARDAT